MTSSIPFDELAALKRLQSWPGLSGISEALKRIAGEPNFFATMPKIFHAEGVHQRHARMASHAQRVARSQGQIRDGTHS